MADGRFLQGLLDRCRFFCPAPGVNGTSEAGFRADFHAAHGPLSLLEWVLSGKQDVGELAVTLKTSWLLFCTFLVVSMQLGFAMIEASSALLFSSGFKQP